MKKIFYLILVLALPLTVFYTWKSFDNSYAKDDEGVYLELSQELYLNFKEGNFFDATKELYLHRHWKPILHPPLLVPILALTDGDTRSAVAIYGGLLYALITIIVFLYFSRFLKLEMNLIATPAVVLLPWVFGMTTTFNSEIGVCAAIVCLFCAGTLLNFYESLRGSIVAGVLLSLAFCLRPVETVLLTVVCLAYWVARDFLRSRISRLDLAGLLVFSLYLTVTLVLPFFILKRDWSSTEVSVIILTGWALLLLWIFCGRFSKNQNRNFRVFYGVFFAISLFWFVPGANKLMDWIVVANFDYLAKETGQRLNTTLGSFLFFYLQKLGLLTSLLLGLHFLDNLKNPKALFSENALLLVGGLIAFPLFAGMLSYNGDVRYYYGGWLVLTMVLFSQTLQQSRRWYRARFFAVLLAAAVALFNIYAQLAWGPLTYPVSRIQMLVGESFFMLVPREEDPIIPVSQIINEEVLAFNKPKATVLTLKTVSQPFLDTSTLNLLNRESRQNLQFAETSIFAPTPAEHVLNMINHYDFILVGPVDLETSKANAPAGLIAQQLAVLCRADKLAAIEGLENFKLVKRLYLKPYGEHCLYANATELPPRPGLFH